MKGFHSLPVMLNKQPRRERSDVNCYSGWDIFQMTSLRPSPPLETFPRGVFSRRVSPLSSLDRWSEDDSLAAFFWESRPAAEARLLKKHRSELPGSRSEAMTLLTFAGISWTLFLLAENPDAQRKVQAELEEIFAGNQKRHATNEDLARMKYLECCIKVRKTASFELTALDQR